MKRATLSLTGALLLVAGAACADVRGEWTATRHKRDGGKIQLELERGRNNHTGQSMKIADFTGLSAAQIASPTATPVSFSLRREAGTVTLDGTFRNGSGSGEFTFAPNAAFLATVRELGVPVGKGHGGGKHGSAEEQLLTLAILDVSTAYIRSMQAAGYEESLDEYIAMRIFNVTPELVSEYRGLGMTLSADDLVAGQVHGVSPEYVEQMRALGARDVDFDDLIATRIHGATPEYIDEMRALGYGDLDLDDYIAFRIHGVSPRFVEQLAEVGFKDVSADDLVAFRIHGVTPSFIREVTEEGYDDVTADDLVAMKIHGRRR
jgi:hypothetical protein